MENTPILIIGCGDIGCRVAQRCITPGGIIYGSVKTERSAASLQQQGISPLLINLDEPLAQPYIPMAPLIFYFAPPPDTGTTDPRLAAFLTYLETQPPQRVVYISTSGVYGDCGGAWVNEETPVRPQTARAQRRWDAEQAWRAFAQRHGTRLIILRVPGIYGPGRLPLARLRAGTPVIHPAQAPWSNRIHADDLADICVLAAFHPQPSELYNVSDGTPTTMTDYFMMVAAHYHLPPPPTIDMAMGAQVLSAEMMSFLAESRRLDTTRLRAELGFVPRYPTVSTGLTVS